MGRPDISAACHAKNCTGGHAKGSGHASGCSLPASIAAEASRPSKWPEHVAALSAAHNVVAPARQRGRAFCLPSIGQFVLRNDDAAHAADSSSPSLALSQAVGTFNRRPNRTVRMSPECAAAYVAPRRNPRTFPVSGQSGKTAFSLSSFRISSMETSLAFCWYKLVPSAPI